MSARLRAALVPLLLAAPALGNEARIQQSRGAMGDFTLDQAPGGGHRLGGVESDPAHAADLVFAPDNPALLEGDFSRLTIKQGGAGSSSVGLDIDADTADIKIVTEGADTVLLHARAGDLASRIVTDGAGARTVNVFVDAAGETVSHALTLGGVGDLSVDVNQTARASLVADITALGPNARASFEQSGSGARANVGVTLHEAASFALNQTAENTSAIFTTTVERGGSLTVDQTEANNSITDVMSVGADHSVTVKNGVVQP